MKAQERMHFLVRITHTLKTSENSRNLETSIHELNGYIHNPNVIAELQRQGGLEALVAVASMASLPEHTRLNALATLSQIAAHYQFLCPQIGSLQPFIPLILSSFKNPNCSEDFKDTLVVCMTCVLAFGPECHSNAAQVVPALFHTLLTSHNQLLRADCVRFFNQLSTYPSSRFLITPAIPTIQAIMNSANLDLACTSACCAVANAAVGDPAIFRVDPITAPNLAKLLLQAFSASLYQKDFPDGSLIFYQHWKLCMGLSNMCLNMPFALVLREQGLVRLLKKALRLTAGSPQLVEHALVALWRLTEHE
eukprot:c18144_g1_i1.p1 GENE.c18144_g1_i1~~c18144_g1_i1.p1  ORF type:complete len:308 (-),score=51.12 c18144_g1_i1:8-931(-)